MKNPNSPANRISRFFHTRWNGEDFPGGEPRFQVLLLAKDISIFVLLPVLSVIVFRSFESDGKPKRSTPVPRSDLQSNSLSQQISQSQVIVFSGNGKRMTPGAGASGAPRRSPGTLVKLKLLNVIETYGNAPVHAQIVDSALGPSLIGGTLIGDAVADTGIDRININFRTVRDPNRVGTAFSISARALSLDGTLGMVANKKEGAFTRSVYNGASTVPQEGGKKVDSLDLKDIVVKALSTGLLQELGSGAQVERNRAQVLTLAPGTLFFAELSDFFPGGQ
jgi:hypothetical protein